MTSANIAEIKILIYELKPKLSAGIDQIPPLVLRYFPDNFFFYLVAYLSSCHDKAINALYELA